MRMLIHDFGGYAFPLQLSEALSRRGHEVIHMYCASHQTTPPGINQIKTDAQPLLRLRPVSLKRPLNKYNFVKRWQQENEYGRLTAQELKHLSPDVVISANTPLDAQSRLLKASRQSGIPFVFWLQDLISIAARQILTTKIPVFGNIVGAYYTHLEKSILQKSSAVIAITDGFEQTLKSWSVAEKKIHVVPNWAPIDRLPALQKNNNWSRAHQLNDAFCFMYTGTLGMKHNPDLLLQLALSFKANKDVQVVVISQGLGASWLAEKKKAHQLNNLHVLPYQPADSLPEVLASSDVLIALLDEQAGAFSVPSKVLTYLCAARPLLLAMPPDNQAARLVQTKQAGEIVAASDTNGFLKKAHLLYKDQQRRINYGQNARDYAEKAFSVEMKADRFLDILSRL